MPECRGDQHVPRPSWQPLRLFLFLGIPYSLLSDTPRSTNPRPDDKHQRTPNPTRPTQVDHAELKRAIENLIRPCALLRFERKRRRERQAEAEAAAHRAESWREGFAQRMEALHSSKASHFLEAVSVELRHRRLQIRDVFREVDVGKSGGLGECGHNYWWSYER